MPTLGVRPRDDQLRQRGYLVLVEGEYPSFYKILGRLIRVHRVLLTVQRGKWPPHLERDGYPQGKGG